MAKIVKSKLNLLARRLKLIKVKDNTPKKFITTKEK